MTWKDLLARKADFIGGMIQVRNGDGMYRARIRSVDESEPTVHFRTQWATKEVPEEGVGVWKESATTPICRFPTTYTLLGSLPGRVQFDIPGGWVIIYPKNDPVAQG